MTFMTQKMTIVAENKIDIIIEKAMKIAKKIEGNVDVKKLNEGNRMKIFTWRWSLASCFLQSALSCITSSMRPS